MQLLLRTLFLLAALTLALGCGTPAASGASPGPAASPAAPPPASYAGEYALTVSNTPAGTINGTLILTENEEGLTGRLTGGGTTTELKSVTTTEDGISVNFYSAEYQTDITMRLTGAPGAATLEGRTLGEYPTTATRK